ncbi:MAG: universal stress protein [Thermodesulfobacteriota bacterium]|nr:universal stress protein [Thermodesulfobacteriota bacterium]
MAGREKLLIAVDETETSMYALRYVARVAGAMEETSICLLHIYPEPPPDYYMNGGTLSAYKEEQNAKAERVFSQAMIILTDAGVSKERISTDNRFTEDKTISEELLAVRSEGDFGTVVVGKRGVSRTEEFLFGSISNALAQHSVNFTTWIVGSDEN